MTQSRSLELVTPATGFRNRLFGLLMYSRLAEGAGLWLAPCKAIHTFGMRFPLDIVFVARDGIVLRIDHAVPPCRFRVCWRAWSVVELSQGWAVHIGIKPGDLLRYPPAIKGHLRGGYKP